MCILSHTLFPLDLKRGRILFIIYLGPGTHLKVGFTEEATQSQFDDDLKTFICCITFTSNNL